MEDSRIVDLYWEHSEQALYETQHKHDRLFGFAAL